MKNSELGQRIQILANIAVLAGIIFLAYEIRQNSITTEIASAQNMIASLSDQINLIIEHDELAVVFAKSMQGEELTPSEAIRFQLFVMNNFRAWQSLFFQYERGALDEELWHTTKMEIGRVFQGEMRKYWEDRRDFYSPSFNAELESLIGRETGD